MTATAHDAIRPILAIDSGATRTKVALLAAVDGMPRLVSGENVPTVVPSSGDEQEFPVRRALQGLERSTGWRLLDGEGILDPAAVPTTVLSTSRVPPVRTAVICPSREDLGSLIAKLSTLGCVEIVFSASFQSHMDDGESPIPRLIVRADQTDFEALLVKTNSTREAATLAAILRAVRTRSVQRPELLFSGLTEIAAILEQELSVRYDVRHISTASWFDKDFVAKDLTSILSRIRAAAIERTNGLGDVLPKGMVAAATAVTPTDGDDLAGLLSNALEASVCVVDVGGNSTSVLVTERGETEGKRVQAPSVKESHQALGTAQGLRAVLLSTNLDEIKRWLPFDVSDTELRDYLGNRALRPWSVAQDAQQLLVEQAVARVCGLASRPGEVRSEVLIATGGMADYPRLAQTVLTLLDIAQPTAPCRVLVDSSSLLPRLSVLAPVNGLAALSLLRYDTFVNAGPCLSVIGRAKPGETVGEIGLQRSAGDDDASTQGEEVHEIRYGTITLIPLRPDEQAVARIVTGKKFSFGIEAAGTRWSQGPREESPNAAGAISGGVLGLLIDARGRPMALGDGAQRQARLCDWLRSLDAFDAEVFSGLD